jgi:NADPH-dependent 2,4-dienoyl-CoA reductase/sulfur reductase-like enzyme/rhodanese-related sulfurtransferase
MGSSPRVIIIGGVAGGMSAATRLRRLDERAGITVLERGEHVSFANCGLPYHLSDAIPNRESLLLHTPTTLAARFDIDVRTHREVLCINREAHTVTVRALDTGVVEDLPYDKLILSPGASAVRPPLPGIDLTFVLRSVSDLDRLKEAVRTRGRNVVVVGAGFIGVEVAENLSAAGKHVTVVEATAQVLPPLDPEMAAPVAAELQRHGVELHLGAGVQSIRADSITLADGRTLPADVVVLAVGVRPEDELARAAGLVCAERGGIIVNETLQTNDPDIYAVGDAALVKDAMGNTAFVALAWGANRQGRLAADHIMGRPIRFGGHPATAIAKVFDLTVATTGLSERQVRHLGIDPAVVHTHPGSHAGYYPGAETIDLKLVFDRVTGRIYGAQAVGGQGTDKRIDVIATALHAGLTAPDLADLPLAYAPPYGSAKDPVNMLGYVAENVIDGLSRTMQWHEVDGTDRIVVDVREPYEFAAGAIPGAVNIPLPQLRDHVGELAGRKVLVNCQVGVRGHTATRLLDGEGIDAVNLDGGYLTWLAGRGSRSA